MPSELKSIDFANGKKENIFVLSIPDWGVTPYGRLKKIDSISDEIDRYNRLVQKTCVEKGVKFYDITDISRKVNLIDGLLASDGLHPSALMYAMWVDKIIEFFNCFTTTYISFFRCVSYHLFREIYNI